MLGLSIPSGILSTREFHRVHGSLVDQIIPTPGEPRAEFHPSGAVSTRLESAG